MKINLDQLKNHSKLALMPIYLVSGDEALLVEETCEYFKKRAQAEGYAEYQRFEVTARFNWDELAHETQSLSLFSTKKIIDLQLSNAKQPKATTEALMALTTKPSEDTLFIIRTPKLTSAQQKAKWYTQLEQVGLAITIWPITAAQYPAWLRRRLQRAKLATDNEGIALLASLTEGNLLAAKQSIEKLSLLYGEAEISAAQIADCLNDNSRFDIYALLEACLQQDAKRSMLIFDRLYNAGTEPTLILWVLNKELLALTELAYANNHKEPLAPIWQKHAIWQNRQALLRQHLQASSYHHYQQQLKLAAQCDQYLKGAVNGDLKQALANLVLSFNPRLRASL
jgi:DNA polymerase-3 subunit delta